MVKGDDVVMEHLTNRWIIKERWYMYAIYEITEK